MKGNGKAERLLRGFCRANGLTARLRKFSWGSPLSGWRPQFWLEVRRSGRRVLVSRDGGADMLGGIIFDSREGAFASALRQLCSCDYVYSAGGYRLDRPASSPEELEFVLSAVSAL